MPSLLNNVNIPGIFNGLTLDEKINIGSYRDLVDYILKVSLIPFGNSSAIKKFDDFDTSYLRKASENGSKENEFFTKFISPVLERLGKESDPGKLLSNIDDIKLKKKMLSDEDKKNAYTSGFSKKITDDVIPEIYQYLDNSDAYLNNFKGGSFSNTPVSEIYNITNYVNSTGDPNSGDISFNIFDKHINDLKTTTAPFGLIVKGLQDEKGEEIGDIIIGAVANIPGNESYISQNKDGNIEFTPEGSKRFEKDYLSDERIYNYIKHSQKSSEGDVWTDTIKELLDIIKIQKERGVDVKKSISFFPKYFNQEMAQIRKERKGSAGVHKIVSNEIVRDVNNANKGLGEKYKSLTKIARDNQFVTPLNYLKNIKSSYDKKEDKEEGPLSKSEVIIPYDIFNQKFHIKKGGNEDSNIIYNTYQKHFEDSKDKIEKIKSRLVDEKDPKQKNRINKELKSAEKNITKNPLPERKLQDLLNDFFTEEEKDDVRYISTSLYDAIDKKNVNALKQWFTSSKGRTRLNIDPNILEHATPISALSNFLWEDIYLELLKRGKQPDEIKEILNNSIKALYYEVLLSRSEDDYKLNGKLKQNHSISDKDKEDLLNGKANPSIAWKRYNLGAVPTPVRFSDMQERFPDKITGVTYKDMLKESKYSIKNILSEYYYFDMDLIKDTKDNFSVIDNKGNTIFSRDVKSEDDFEKVQIDLAEEIEEDQHPLDKLVLNITDELRKDASAIAKKYQKIRIGDTKYILDTKESSKLRSKIIEVLVWKENKLWRPRVSPKTKPQGFKFMNEIRDILSPEASKKISQRRAEELKKMLGGKSFMQASMDSMKMASEVRQIEEPYKDQLEELAKEIVYKMYPILKDANIEIDAKITDGMKATPPQKEENEEEIDQEQFDVSVEEAGVDKRRLLNALTQGASLKGSRSYVLFDEILNLMSDGLREKYDELLNNAYGIYNSDEALAMMLAMMSQGGGGAQGGGDVDIFYDEEKDRPVIKATGVTFPILLQEIIKGLYENIAQFGTERAEGSTEEDFRTAFMKNAAIRKRTDTYKKELTDISDGPYAYEALLDVYLSTEMNPQRFPEWYKNLVEIVPSSDFKIFIDNVITGKLSGKDEKYILNTISKTAKELNKDE